MIEQPKFKPGNKIYFARIENDRIVAKVGIITDTVLTYRSEVSKKYSLIRRKMVATIDYILVETRILTKTGLQFTVNNTEVPKIFKSKAELLNSQNYKNNIT